MTKKITNQKQQNKIPQKNIEPQITNLNNNLLEKLLKNNWLVFLIFLIVISILYGKTINYDFVLDDKIVISKNINVQKGISAIPSIFSNSTFFGSELTKSDRIYRPLTLSSYAAEISLFGLKPGIHHLFNLLYYVTLCFLLFILLSRYILKNYGILLSFIIIILYIIHPIHTEVVCNIKSRDEILCFLFGTLSLISLLKAFKIVKNKQKILYLSASSILFFISLFTKETSVIFVFLFILCLFYFSKIDFKKDKKYLLYFSGLSLIFTFIYFYCRTQALTGIAIQELDSHNNALIVYGFFQRYSMTLYIMLLYLKLLILPHPLIWDYSIGHFYINNSIILYGIISLVLHLVLLIYAIVNLKKKTIWAFCIWFYLITIALVCNIFILIGSTMGERFMFIPSLAFCIFVVIGINKLISNDNFLLNKSILTLFSIRVIFLYKDIFSVL